MEINFEKKTIKIFGKKANLDGVISKFVQLSGDQLSHFLKNRPIKVPRALNRLALMKVLNNKIKTLNSNSLSIDYFNRLKYYKDFTEEQYAILFNKIADFDDDAFLEYRYNFVTLLFLNNAALDFSDGEINYVRNIGKEKMEDFDLYVKAIDSACLDQEGMFDGISIDKCKEVLPESAPAHEIRYIALKYGYDIPQRLTKELLLEYIHDVLGSKISADEFNTLSELTLNQINDFCAQVKLQMSSALDKNETVNYLLYLLDKAPQEYSSIKELVVPSDYVPLEFTVDISVINPFGNATPVKVVHYEGEEDKLMKQKIILVDDDQNTDVEEKAKKYNISFELNGHGDAVNNIADVNNIPLTLPMPNDPNFKFVNWYLDPEFTNEVLLNKELDSDITLYAKWEELPQEEIKFEGLDEVLALKEENQEEAPQEEIVEETRAEDAPVEESPAPEAPQEEIKEEGPAPEILDDLSSTKNDLYGSKKITRTKGKIVKLCFLLAFLAIFIGILLYLLIALLV